MPKKDWSKPLVSVMTALSSPMRSDGPRFGRKCGFWALAFQGFRVLGFQGFRVLGFRVRVSGFGVLGFRV